MRDSASSISTVNSYHHFLLLIPSHPHILPPQARHTNQAGYSSQRDILTNHVGNLAPAKYIDVNFPRCFPETLGCATRRCAIWTNAPGGGGGGGGGGGKSRRVRESAERCEGVYV